MILAWWMRIDGRVCLVYRSACIKISGSLFIFLNFPHSHFFWFYIFKEGHLWSWSTHPIEKCWFLKFRNKKLVNDIINNFIIETGSLCIHPITNDSVYGYIYKMTQCRFFLGSGGSRAANMASSKTFFNPRCVSAEHSTYLTAFNSFASFSPCSEVIGFCLFLASFSTVAASSRRSIWVPTRRNGVFWQWCVISGTHFSFTFSNEDGETTEKQTKNTSVCG